MALGLLTLLIGLSISAVAIYYSVLGLVAIFAAAAIPIIVMGGVLEVGKLVTAVWLHRYWHRATWWLKTYLSTAVVVLMFITSMGIFGFLSKAHIEQTSASEESVAKVEQIEVEVGRLQAIIDRSEKKIEDLETSGTGGQANIQSQIDIEQQRIDDAYKRAEPLIAEQNEIIDNIVGLYENQIEALDKDFNQLQAWINEGGKENIKRVQGMVGTSPDGSWGFLTSNAVDKWRDENRAKRDELVKQVQSLSSNPDVVAARKQIEEIRANVESQVSESNKLINTLRNRLTTQNSENDVTALIDEQYTKIREATDQIDTLTEEKYALQAEYRKLEAEVGPIKYIAEFIYGDTADKNMLEEAVRWVIVVIIFVFDPLAVLLLIASQYTFQYAREERNDEDAGKEEDEPDDDGSEPTDPNTDGPSDESDTGDQESVPEEQTDNTEPVEEEVDEKNTQTKEEAISQDEESGSNTDTQPSEEETKEIVKSYAEALQAQPDNKSDIDAWNEWVEAANEAVEEDEHEEWDEAKKSWKRDNPDDTLKRQRKLLNNGLIDQLPWETDDYQQLNSTYQIMPELIETEYFDKEGFDQVKKTGYRQNEEQTEGTLWARVKRSDSE